MAFVFFCSVNPTRHNIHNKKSRIKVNKWMKILQDVIILRPIDMHYISKIISYLIHKIHVYICLVLKQGQDTYLLRFMNYFSHSLDAWLQENLYTFLSFTKYLMRISTSFSVIYVKNIISWFGLILTWAFYGYQLWVWKKIR